MKTRILMFGWEFPPFNSGGLGVACLGLTRALSRLGTEVIFVMPKKLDITSPWAKIVFADPMSTDRQGGLEIATRAVNIALSPYVTSKSYLRGRGVSDSIYGRDLLSEVMRYALMGGVIAREEVFDVIYAHDWLSFGAGIEAKRATGKPLIVHVHATEFDRCGGPWGINHDVYEIEKAGMEDADVVIAVSELTKNILIQNYGISPNKIRVVYNGIDETTVPMGGDGLPRLRQLKAAGYGVVLFLGRVTLQKGPDYFIRAAQRVLQKNPNIYFILVGTGDMEQNVMELAARLGISDRVFFTGHMSGSDLHEVYTVADLFVMPSVSEPFGITPLEAMKLGTPVLISKQSGVSEVVQHALKVDFWDIDDMANKILSVIQYSKLSESLSKNGAIEAGKLTWTQAALKVDNIVHDLMAA
ncbi:MAG: glycosyltransferase family 4 protein [bacterium]|nr:glycosyltransferase family 4 protein [bacterium]